MVSAHSANSIEQQWRNLLTQNFQYSSLQRGQHLKWFCSRIARAVVDMSVRYYIIQLTYLSAKYRTIPQLIYICRCVVVVFLRWRWLCSHSFFIVCTFCIMLQFCWHNFRMSLCVSGDWLMNALPLCHKYKFSPATLAMWNETMCLQLQNERERCKKRSGHSTDAPDLRCGKSELKGDTNVHTHVRHQPARHVICMRWQQGLCTYKHHLKCKYAHSRHICVLMTWRETVLRRKTLQWKADTVRPSKWIGTGWRGWHNIKSVENSKCRWE